MKRLQIIEDTSSDCGCRNQCLDKFSIEDKVALIDSLYNGRPKTEFDLYLKDMISQNEPRRKRPKKQKAQDSNNNSCDDRNGNQRPCSFSYSVMKGAQKVLVCRKAFIQLHAVSHKAVYRLTSLLANGNIPSDTGRKRASKAVSAETANQIHNHIRSFPPYYVERPVTYLGAQLTVRTMYKLFCTRYPELKEAVNYDCYLRHFKEHRCKHRDVES